MANRQTKEERWIENQHHRLRRTGDLATSQSGGSRSQHWGTDFEIQWEGPICECRSAVMVAMILFWRQEKIEFDVDDR